MSKASIQDWVTLSRFEYPHEAQVLKTKLESEGIRCFLTNEHFLGVNPLASHAVGGVELKVLKSDLRRAQELIQSQEIHEIDFHRECPECQSTSLSAQTTDPKEKVFEIKKVRWCCKNCGYSWRTK